jgi:hypothetical protein
MADQLIDEIISPLAFAQVEKMKAEMQGLTDKFIQAGLGVDALNKALADAKGMGALSNNIAKAQESTTQYVDAGKQLLALQQKIALATSAEGEEIAKLRLQLQLLNESNKDRIKDSKAQEGSITQMRIRLKELQKGYDDMAAAERNAGNGTALLNHIKAVDTELKKLEGGSGRFQRNVGNYSNATFQLSQSLRELPAFAFSAQTGILALSNNLPMLIDEFNKMKLKVDETSGKVLGARGAFLEFGKSIFTFTNIFTIALGLFTVFYKEIVQFTSEIIRGSKGLDAFAESNKILNESLKASEYETAIKNVNRLTVEIDLAKKGFYDKNEVVKYYNKTLGETLGYAKSLDDVERSIVDNGDAYILMTLKKAVANEALERSAKLLIEKELKLEKTQEEIRKNLDDEGRYKAGGLKSFQLLFQQGLSGSDEEKLSRQVSEEVATLDKDVNTLKGIASEAEKEAVKISKTFKLLGYDKDGKSKKAKSDKETNRIESLKKEFEVEKALLDRSLNEKQISQEAYYEKLSQLAYKYVADRKGLTKEEKQDEIIWNDELVKISVDSYLKLSKMLADRLKEMKDADAEMVKSALKAIEEQAKAFDKFNKWRHNAINALKNAEIQADKEVAQAKSRTADQIRAVQEAELRDTLATLEILKSFVFATDTLFQTLNDIENARLDNKQTKMNEYYDSEEERINKSFTNKSQKELELAKLAAKREAEQKSIDRDRKKAEIDQAKRSKAISIAETMLNTYAAVMAYQVNPGGYPGIALSIAAGIAGAAKIAQAIATPLPQFAKGTEHSPEGYAIVGEKGTELVTEPSGKSWLTPAKDTVAYLKKGSKVTTNEKLMEMVKNSAYVEMANLNMPITTDLYTKVLIEKFEENTNELKALKGIMKDKNMNVQVLGNYDHYLHVRKNIR